VPRNDAQFLRRNALVALGNVGGVEHIDVLEQHSADEHARWAIEQIEGRAALGAPSSLG
jgi:epoxyqueuosine reductase QueG